MTRKPTKRQGPTKRPNGSKPTPDGARGVPSAQAGARRLPPLDPDDAKVATELAGLGCSDPAVAAGDSSNNGSLSPEIGSNVFDVGSK
jgi:hypothetical protein